MVTALQDIIGVLATADPADKAEVYAQLGLTLTYRPQEQMVLSESRPVHPMYVRMCPRGDLNPHALNGH